MADEMIQPGDLVVLKSGGPTMTAGASNAGSGLRKCYWFVANELKTADFRDEVLRKP